MTATDARLIHMSARAYFFGFAFSLPAWGIIITTALALTRLST